MVLADNPRWSLLCLDATWARCTKVKYKVLQTPSLHCHTYLGVNWAPGCSLVYWNLLILTVPPIGFIIFQATSALYRLFMFMPNNYEKTGWSLCGSVLLCSACCSQLKSKAYSTAKFASPHRYRHQIILLHSIMSSTLLRPYRQLSNGLLVPCHQINIFECHHCRWGVGSLAVWAAGETCLLSWMVAEGGLLPTPSASNPSWQGPQGLALAAVNGASPCALHLLLR